MPSHPHRDRALALLRRAEAELVLAPPAAVAAATVVPDPFGAPATVVGDAPGRGAPRPLRSGAVLGAGVMIATALNAAFHFVLARLLVPSEYSLMVSLFTVVLVLTVPTMAIQATVAREVAVRGGTDAAGAAVMRGTFGVLGRWTLVVIGACTAVGVPVFLLAGIDRPIPFVATVAAVVGGLLVPVAWGGLQGLERFTEMSLATMFQAAAKIGVCAALAAAGLGVAGVMGGLAVAAGLTALVSVWPLRAALRGISRAERAPVRLGAALQAAAVLSAFAALTSTDLLASRFVMTPDEAGQYAAAGTAGRLMLVASGVAAAVLFPRFAARDGTNWLIRGVSVLVPITAVGVAVLLLFPEPLVRLAFGDEYLDASQWLGPLALAMGVYGLAQVYLNHFLALERWRFAAVLCFLMVLQGIAYWLLDADADELIAVQIVSALILLPLCALYARRAERLAASS